MEENKNNTAAVSMNVGIENEPEAKEILELMKDFTPAQKKEMLSFAQGMKFAKQIS